MTETNPALQTDFTRQAGIEVPMICGAMYPCSNPELIAAVSEAGGIGIVQPLSLVYVYGYEFRKGLQRIRELTAKPIGFNVIVEKTSRIYEERMRRWVDEALEEGVRFFVTALGNPTWVVEKVHQAGGVVYHDVTERKWADKAVDCGVDGLICVNSRAGGHAGRKTPAELVAELEDLGLPLVCAGGIGDETAFLQALDLGYAGVQMGTRFIATPECDVHQNYREAIVQAGEDDIVLTERISGVPVAVINSPQVQKHGTKAGPVARLMLKGRKTKHWMRTIYALRSLYTLKRGMKRGLSYKDVFQAGKSVAGVGQIEPAGDIVRRFAAALAEVRKGETARL
ncbi:MAG: nitronate monooxygenase [Planctomycetota bacterium]|nr:MAG: nitronate monooxygenase [Planctomycetota bacterium]